MDDDFKELLAEVFDYDLEMAEIIDFEFERIVRETEDNVDAPIVIYGANICEYTQQALKYLAYHPKVGIKNLRYINCSRDAKSAVKMIEISGQMGVPVIADINSSWVVVGFGPHLIEPNL